MKHQKLLARRRNDLESKKNKLNDLNERLDERKNSMRLKLEKRDKMKNDLLKLDIDNQMKELNNFNTKIVEIQGSLNDINSVCKDNDLKINDISQEVHETKVHLESIKNEYDYNCY